MTDPTFTTQDFLNAELVVDSLLQNLAIQFHTEGDNFSRERMTRHVNDRMALINTKRLLLDEGERLLKGAQ